MKQLIRQARRTSTALCLAGLFSLSHAAHASASNFDQWLLGFKQQALAAGISQSTLESAFKGVHVDDKVLDSDQNQSEFTKTFFEYINRAVSEQRVANGQKAFKKNQALLTEVETKYGVPAEVLAAFWGMETNYGGYTGNLSIIQSLATLAYDPRRSGFFTKELIAALKILDAGNVELTEMKGSWAGAMGQVQFMPSNYLKYAVDGDGDGKINLWKSLPDAFYSAGNFLNHLGWNRQNPWGYEVQLPKKFDYAIADGRTEKTLADWRKVGIRLANGKVIPNSSKTAKLVLPSDYRGPAFLVFDNFRVIKRWNNSTNYALGVGYLSQRISGGAKLSKQQPKDDKGLSRTQVKEIQALLNRLGYPAGKPDGIAGANTRSALRNFQKQIGVPADGFVSARMLNKLRKASRNKNS